MIYLMFLIVFIMICVLFTTLKRLSEPEDIQEILDNRQELIRERLKKK